LCNKPNVRQKNGGGEGRKGMNKVKDFEFSKPGKTKKAYYFNVIRKRKAKKKGQEETW